MPCSELNVLINTFTWNAVYTQSAIKKTKNHRVQTRSCVSFLSPAFTSVIVSHVVWFYPITFGIIRCRKMCCCCCCSLYGVCPVCAALHSFMVLLISAQRCVFGPCVHGKVNESAVGGWITSLLACYDHSGGEEAAGLQTQTAVLWERRAQISGSLGSQPKRTGRCTTPIMITAKCTTMT